MSAVMTAKKPRLNDEQVRQFNTDGYVIYREPVLPHDKFLGLKNHFEEKLQRLPDGYRPEAMDVPHFTDLKLFEWLFADEVLDLVEPILGPDIALFSSHFICKPRGNGKRVPWHEDSFYWRGMMDPMAVCTVWLAIDPSTKQNGCMNVIPAPCAATATTRMWTPSKMSSPPKSKATSATTARKLPSNSTPTRPACTMAG
jgi:hypothetical protein